MNLLMIPSTMLPFPPVKGGAVQNLIRFYVEWNEREHKHNLTIFSIYNREAQRNSHKWNYCRVVFFRVPGVLFKLRSSSNKYVSGIGFKAIHALYINRISNYIRKNRDDFDEIILNNAPQFAQRISDAFDKKVLIHIYNDYLNENTKDIDVIMRCTSKVITVSDYISRIVRNTGLIPDQKIYTLHNGVELERFNTPKSIAEGKRLRQSISIKETDCVILFVARLVPDKGIRELIQAFNLAVRADCRLKLVVVGNKLYGENISDPFLLELQALASENMDSVFFTGYVDYEKLPGYYSMADIGALPSLYEEPFALAAIEYMASRLAVILSDAGGFPEMVSGDAVVIVKRGQGFVNRLAKAILQISSDKELMNHMKDCAYIASRQYGTLDYCTRLNEIIEKE